MEVEEQLMHKWSSCLPLPCVLPFHAEQIIGIGLRTELDPMRIRPTENPCIIGDNAKMRHLGWNITYSLESSIRDMMA